MKSALYVGGVMHRRVRPKTHHLRYRVFWMLLDLDELSELSALRLFSLERFNVFGFHAADHGDGSETPLRTQAERLLMEAGVNLGAGTIQFLCMPRILGYVFNPISVYFCRDAAGRLAAVIYEVNNTFGERHSYVFRLDRPDSAAWHHCAKSFYVSPFIDMDLKYDFRLRGPGDHVALSIRGSDDRGMLIAASLAGRRQELTDGALLRVFATHPLLTLKVTAGIHWEALKLWLKGVKLRPRPPVATQAQFVVAPPPRVEKGSARHV